MLRKILFAMLALVTIGAAAVPNTAQARGWGGRGGGGRGWGRGVGWGAVGLGVGLGLAAGYPYYGYGPGPYGCWRTVRVATPYGWRWRRVWVC